MTLTLAQIDLLEDTWAAGRALRPVRPACAARRRSTGTSTPSPQGFWAVTRYDDVRAVSRDHETFSAELGSTFVTDQTTEALEMIRMTILNMDPPKHCRYRRLVSAGFTPRMIDQLVDEHPASGRSPSSPASRDATRSISSRTSPPSSRCR